MIDAARAEPLLIEKHGRGVVMVISVEEYERLTARRDISEEPEGLITEEAKEMTNQAARSEIDQLLKDSDWHRTGDLKVHHEYRHVARAGTAGR